MVLGRFFQIKNLPRTIQQHIRNFAKNLPYGSREIFSICKNLTRSIQQLFLLTKKTDALNICAASKGSPDK